MSTKAALRDALRARYVRDMMADESRSGINGDTGSVISVNVGSGGIGRTDDFCGEIRERAFVVEGRSGRVTISGPAHTAVGVEKAQAANKGFLYVDGRFVEADSPNRNGAYWSTRDLELGQVTVAGGPLNWLHEEYTVIGSLMQSSLVYRESASDIGTHLTARSAVWRFLHPDKARAIEAASANRMLWYSMECVSESVQCLDTPGRPGCGESFDYGDYIMGKTCAHLRERSSIKRLVDPTFLGGAIIVPPVQPGWADAEATVRVQAAELADREGLGDLLEHGEALQMASAILRYANRPVTI